MRDSGIGKFLTVYQLIRKIRCLPVTFILRPNEVQNLSIYDEDMNYWGFVDFSGQGHLEERRKKGGDRPDPR